MKLPKVFTILFCLPFVTSATPVYSQNLTSLDQVPEGLEKSDWQSIRAAYEAGRHTFAPVESGWQARNPGQQWTTHFDGRGFLATPQDSDWTWGLELRSYGFGQEQIAVTGQPKVSAEGQLLSYQWDSSLQEWWINDSRGLEHGYVIAERPEVGATDEVLSFTLATRGNLKPAISPDAKGVFYQDENGSTMLTYSGLKVWDADGKILTSRFEEGLSGQIRLLVEEQDARYPITIDPIAQQAYLKASNSGGSDFFGTTVAISGDTVVVGADGEDSNATGVSGNQANNSASSSGAAYVFIRSGTSWTQQAYLKASNTGSGDGFGSTVSISGDTVVVGARGEDSNATGVNGNQTDNSTGASGAVYVFVRSGTTWTQQAYLKASNTGTSDLFGVNVSVDSDTLLVAAYGEASNASGVNGNQADNSATRAGAAYVFVRNGTNWAQQAYLKASNAEPDEEFGFSVSISGDTAVVTARNEDSNATGVNDNQTDNSASNSGAAYVFARSGTTWTQQAYLKASNTGTDDQFGYCVSNSGDTVVVSARNEDSSATGVNGDQANNSDQDSGAAYIFVRNGTTWAQQAYLKASNKAIFSMGFGYSVAIDGDTAVVGAISDDSDATGVNGNQTNTGATVSGAAYVFVRSGTSWTQQAYLKASNTGSGDQFGKAVSISGDTAVVGAIFEDSNATGVDGNQADNSASYAGAAYTFAGLGPRFPEITLKGNGAEITNGDLTPDLADHTDFNTGIVGGVAVTRTFMITNTGPGILSLNGSSLVDISGSSHFSVTTQPISDSVSENGGSQTFEISYVPLVSGNHMATISISSNDTDENPYSFSIKGMALSSEEDEDGDGLNDAAEYKMSALGFDWQVSQPSLVSNYRDNANLAGYYTIDQVQTIHIETPLLQRDAITGAFTLTLALRKSLTLEPGSYVPFPITTPETSINTSGELEFQFTSEDDAAFYRVEGN